ncbi:multidrug ABC transporter substrate-binding protein [Candidatus Peregrinibacteria bacterium CG10_big_fil_rev_8_21_14_0_10_55_24]|nr:MAG: multidrug ABC transporter substrate-binding protein [Candidatus Peregrinibacteria bacterium CG10_big_fil_rev_8_21_14_0_10_55_24]
MLELLENIRSALDAIRSNKLRSGLTMLGVIIGVASVILMVAVGRGAQKQITERIESLGTNLLIVQSGSPSQSDVRSLFRRSGSSTSTLTSDDVVAIKENVTGLRGVSPELKGNMQVIVGNQNMQTTVAGVAPDYPQVNNFVVEYGSFITQEHIDRMEKVVVLGQEIVTTLFPNQNPIGQDIRLQSHIFQVIGIMASKGQQGVTNYDDMAFIPLTTMQERVQGTKTLSTINVSVEDQAAMEQTSALLTAVLLNTHRKSAEDQDFNILNQAETVETLNEVTQTFTYLLGGIAAISLLVGGIGVMNIMLVSVTERTREIGIRKAIGAKKRDILQQFLVESMVLSVLGGLVGILSSSLGSWLLNTFSSLSAIISINSVILACAFSIGVGVLFGILPALKAATLKPIDALRYE